jgi:monoamine oxidase
MKVLAIAAASIAALSLAGSATAEDKRASPHADATAALAGKKITISYGRPFMKGRAIFGGLVPWGQVWRTGADEATTFTTEADVVVGGLKVPKGEYSLFTVPTEKQWTLVLNKTAKQWGAFKYDAAQDLGRAPMTITTSTKPVEQFTIEIVPAGKQLTLKLSWDKTVATVAISS